MITKKDLKEFTEWLDAGAKMTWTEWMARKEDEDKTLKVKAKRPRKKMLSETEFFILLCVLATGFVGFTIVLVAFIS